MKRNRETAEHRTPFGLSLSKPPRVLSLSKGLSLSKPPRVLSLSFDKLRMIGKPFGLSLSKPPRVLSLSKGLSLSKPRASAATGTSTSSGCTGTSTSSVPSTSSGCTGTSTSSVRTAVVAFALCVAGPAFAQTQGVSRNEIVLGSIQDLSGPIAGFGKQIRNGVLLRVDELNEQGGIHGRKVKVIFEDSAYDPKKAVLAAQKLVNQDKIFAMVGHIGTPTNNAAMPVQFQKNVINFFPVTAAREMYEPFHKLKFANGSSYYDQMRVSLPRLVKEKGARKVCILYQDDDFGLEVLRGAEAGVKSIGMELVEKTSYKRGATDFSSQVARMKSSECDFVVLGTIIRETIGTIAEGRKTGFNPTYLGSSAVYTDLIHKLGGKAMDGLYGMHTVQHPYLDDASQPIRFWATKYKTKFNEDPTVFSVYGYSFLDNFIKAAQKAGPNLTTDSFIKAMETMKIPSDMFGGPELSFGPNKHWGSNLSRLSQIQDGKWKVVSDYAKAQ